MPITTTETVISAAGMVSECLLVISWAIRGRKRPFWLVGLYGIYHLLISIYLRVSHLRRHDLGDARYYVDEAIDFALLTGITIELFICIVSPFAQWSKRTKRYLINAVAVGTLIPAVLVTFLKFSGLERIKLWDNRLDIFTSALLCTYVLVSGVIAIHLGARRNARAEAIRLGLVGWTSLGLAIDLWHMITGWTRSYIFDEASDTFWVLMLLIWATAIWNSGSETIISQLRRTALAAVLQTDSRFAGRLRHWFS